MVKRKWEAVKNSLLGGGASLICRCNRVNIPLLYCVRMMGNLDKFGATGIACCVNGIRNTQYGSKIDQDKVFAHHLLQTIFNT
jgi:hypothetical protein